MKNKFSILIIMIIFGILILFGFNKIFGISKEKSMLVKHTYEVVIKTKELFSSIQDAETGQRGYLLTQKKSYLEPYSRAIATSDKILQELKSITAENRIQQEQLQLLEKFIALKFEELALTVRLVDQDNQRGALKIVNNDSGKQYMDKIRIVLEEIIQEENRLLAQRTQALDDSLIVNEYIILGLFVLFLALIIFIYFSIVNNKELEIQNKQKEILLLKQSRMAAMGEMIANIAHQWRQPLSVISLAASSLNIQYSLKILTEKEMQNYTDTILNNSKFLSNTINTFRGFLKFEKRQKMLSIQSEIKEAIGIIHSVLKHDYIELKDKINYEENVMMKMTEGELVHVIINIVNNSKDIILERKISRPWIQLEMTQAENEVIITLEDNAGGIESKMLSKVFEPYFTTKHQSQGTGLGLFMSYKIITESFHGKLYAKNTSQGAKFYIHLPLKKA